MTAAVLLVGCGTGFPGRASELRVVYQGAISLPDSVADAAGDQVPVTGVSGITWLGDDRYAAVLDNSQYVLLFRLALSQAGKPVAVSDIRPVKLAQRHDYEDVAPCPAAVAQGLRRQRNRGRDPVAAVARDEQFLLLCEENTPAVRCFSLRDGGMVGAVPLPENLLGRRPNRGLESLAIEPGGRFVWTANEESLPDDGPPAGEGRGTVVRLTRLPLPEAAPAGAFERLRSPRPSPEETAFQAAYMVDPPHDFVRIFAGQPVSGLAALAAMGDGMLVTLERSAGPGLPPFANRIYLVDVREAVDVSGVERDLTGRRETLVKKTLLWQGALGSNLEGLCLGPKLVDGNRALVAVADNGGLGTPNQLVGLALVTPPPPAKPAVLGVVAALLTVAAVVGWLTNP